MTRSWSARPRGRPGTRAAVAKPSVETAQKRVEQRNFLIRKRTLEYDDVMNKQREVVYGFRNEAIDTEDPRSKIYEVIDEAVPKKVKEYLRRTKS